MISKKESFYTSKGVLLHLKTSPFGLQNESFCNPKGLLLFFICSVLLFLSSILAIIIYLQHPLLCALKLIN